MSLDLKNKTVLITGASSGIGRAAAYDFAKQGCRLILTARRVERLEAMKKEIGERYSVDVLPFKLDVQDKLGVKEAFKSLPEAWQAIDVLVNNAGLALSSHKMQEAELEDWDVMVDTNIKGLLYVTHAVLKGMVARNSGHIINISSVAGSEHYLGGNVYSMTKHAVKAISASLRIDLLGSAIRVSDIAPGAVHTEFSEVRWNDKKRSDDFYAGFQPLKAEDISDAAVYCATRPLHVDVSEMKIFPTAQASCNHLHKSGVKPASLFD
ncbi:MAG: hypothetical protein COV52_05275 [Gammaproteobacteria bacterium CG11_big_fil_rev_8_21_14_0_20_46_22]|nr:MAG: hypothetical protein COW05_09980 [Gammaproteobacteria bacterium CG12_big_fil_rev_8_21_14_0_65_46_12]PIR11208.1 MAG: hypothetical protein COV52_05275 [Gammaproteobacteria bacterium CG11_big_fil_rev_8_21_14_0_20_46_22]